MKPLARGQELELEIDSLAYGGRGVARHGELVVFVARALPGDRVRARVTKYKRRYAEARAVEVLEPGPGRVQPRCAHFGVCGGCAWQDLDYAEQLRHKRAQVVDALERLGGFTGVTVDAIEPAVEIYGYRNKVEYSWSMNDDGPALGYHVAGRWDALMAVETCHIVSPRNNDLRRAFEAWAREEGLEAYHQRSGAGYLRHLVVREGRRTGDLLAVLVTAPGDPPALERLAELLGPDVTGVVHAVNDGVAEVTAGLPSRTLLGQGSFRERIARPRAGALAGGLPADQHRDVRRALRPRAGAGRAAARRRRLGPVLRGGRDRAAGGARVRRVVGVEIAAESVASARANAARNGIANAEFMEGDVARELARLLELAERPSVVFVDPPRAGLTPKAVRRLIELAPRADRLRLVQPTTLAPNAQPAGRRRLPLERVRPGGHVPAHAPHRVR